MLRIKLVKSTIGNVPRNRATVAALGLRKINQTVEHADTPTIRGMVHKVKHLLEVTEAEGTPKSNLANQRRATGAAVAEKPAKAKPAAKEAKPKVEKPAKAEKTEDTPAEEAKPKRTTTKKAKTEEEK